MDEHLGAGCAGGETITELYVPLDRLPEFMDAAGGELRQRGANVIYGTVRLIEQGDETFLNWARQRYACVVFNLHVDHTADGIARVGDALRGLIDLAIARNGIYFLTYNRFATCQQLARCYPQFADFRELKSRFDPDGVFGSDWYRSYTETE